MFRESREAVLAVLGWGLLAGGWVRVAVNGTMPTLAMALVPVGVALTASVFTSLWIRHNVSLYRRLAPRRSTRSVEWAYLTDRVGRRVISADVGPTWTQVCVVSSQRRKHYLEVA